MASQRKRSILVWTAAALGALTPAVAFWLSLSAAQRSRPNSSDLHNAAAFLIMPGLYPGLLLGSWFMAAVFSALFWGILAGAAAAMFIPSKERTPAMRTLTILAIPTLLYGALVTWSALNFNPD